MKYKFIIALMLLSFTSIVNAQKIDHNGEEYHVKGDKIFLDKIDITNTLSAEESNTIKNKLKNKLDTAKQLKANKEALKKQKKAEKKQKKAEKELKEKEKAQDNYDDAKKKYEKAQTKYKKLKLKGKLSPEDETKWLDKIEKLKEKTNKKEKKARM